MSFDESNKPQEGLNIKHDNAKLNFGGFTAFTDRLGVQESKSQLETLSESKDFKKDPLPTEVLGFLKNITNSVDYKSLKYGASVDCSLASQLPEGIKIEYFQASPEGTQNGFVSLIFDQGNFVLSFRMKGDKPEFVKSFTGYLRTDGYSTPLELSYFAQKYADQSPIITQLLEYYGVKDKELTSDEIKVIEEEIKKNIQVKEYEQRVNEQYPKIEKLPDWDLTDPRTHDPENFRYIIHAIPDEMQQMFGVARMIDASKSNVKLEKPADPFIDPEGFLKRSFISCSVIDQVHRGTWAGAGLILRVPKQNILKASPSDLGTIPDARYTKREPNLPNAQKILEQTPQDSYNEVVITGTSEEGIKIDYNGVFVIIGTNGKPINPNLASKVEYFAKSRNLPIVNIYKKVVEDNNLF